MRLVVADKGPINYLILIEHIDLLPVLFARVILPFAVEGELTALRSPLASTVDADLLLMDDRKGVKAAGRKGLRVTGTLGILELGTQSGLVDFAPAVGRLRLTNFRTLEALIESLLEKYQKK